MFNGCSSLTDLSALANWDLSSTTNTEAMFQGVTNFECTVTQIATNAFTCVASCPGITVAANDGMTCTTPECTAVDTPTGCIAQDCTAADTPYTGCTAQDCTGVDIPYAGCIAQPTPAPAPGPAASAASMTTTTLVAAGVATAIALEY
jgi:surface protein